jgi:hypothetical protein
VHTGVLRQDNGGGVQQASNIPGFNPCGCIQVITNGMLAGMRKNGGNLLGVPSTTDPLLLLNAAPRWRNAEDDGTVLKSFQKVMSVVKE